MTNPAWTGRAQLTGAPNSSNTFMYVTTLDGATGVANRYSSLYVNTFGPTGIEQGQVFVGNGNGLVLRTINLSPTVAFPISLSPNNVETLRLSPDKSATFRGNVSVQGTLAVTNMAPTAASIDTTGNCFFRSQVMVGGNTIVSGYLASNGLYMTAPLKISGTATNNIDSPTLFKNNVDLTDTELRLNNAPAYFGGSVTINNLMFSRMNPFCKVAFQKDFYLRSVYGNDPLDWKVIPFAGILEQRGFYNSNSPFPMARQKDFQIRETGLYSITVNMHVIASDYDNSGERHVYILKSQQGIDPMTTTPQYSFLCPNYLFTRKHLQQQHRNLV